MKRRIAAKPAGLVLQYKDHTTGLATKRTNLTHSKECQKSRSESVHAELLHINYAIIVFFIRLYVRLGRRKRPDKCTGVSQSILGTID